MTVKDLMKALALMPQDAVVCTYAEDSGRDLFETEGPVVVLAVKHGVNWYAEPLGAAGPTDELVKLVVL